MKKKFLSATIIGLTVASIVACSQNTKNEENKPVQKVQGVKKAETASPNAKIFKQLDKTLSPFEDMTEYALSNNEEGISKSLNQVLKAEKELVFEKNLNQESLKQVTNKVKELQILVEAKKFQEIALLSTDLFEFNTSNFVNANEIENQIKIEHLDYLGFQTLALLYQDQVDWELLGNTITDVEKVWNSLSKNVKDPNLKDSFEYLFKGLHLSAKNKDTQMATILASMDLSLVDVLENAFE